MKSIPSFFPPYGRFVNVFRARWKGKGYEGWETPGDKTHVRCIPFQRLVGEHLIWVHRCLHINNLHPPIGHWDIILCFHLFFFQMKERKRINDENKRAIISQQIGGKDTIRILSKMVRSQRRFLILEAYKIGPLWFPNLSKLLLGWHYVWKGPSILRSEEK